MRYLTAEAVNCMFIWRFSSVCRAVRKRRRMGCRQLMEKRNEMRKADIRQTIPVQIISP